MYVLSLLSLFCGGGLLYFGVRVTLFVCAKSAQHGMSDGWKRLQLADVALQRLLEEASLAAVAPQVMVCMVCELGPVGMSDRWKRL